MLIGVSTRSIEQLRQAILDGADYVGIGPTFPVKTKAFDQLAGLGFIRAASMRNFASGVLHSEESSLLISHRLSKQEQSGWR